MTVEGEAPQDPEAVDPAFREEVLAGLAASIPAIPARWLYDRRGSELFDQITRLPEYYPTRAETALLRRHRGEIAERVGQGGTLVEFGSGSATKTPLLIEALAPHSWVPIDISGEYLAEASRRVSRTFPDLRVLPLEGDFVNPIGLPETGEHRIGFFPGSTIGNFVPRSAVDLLRSMKETLGVGAHLVIGIDRVKEVDVLLRAYDDARGVTAAFNLNLLHRINRELDGDIPLDAFRHLAIWNEERSRIEMHLETTRAVAFHVSGTRFELSKGARIHTENSHKYGERDRRFLLFAGGWRIVSEWSGADDAFSLVLAEAEPIRFAP